MDKELFVALRYHTDMATAHRAERSAIFHEREYPGPLPEFVGMTNVERYKLLFAKLEPFFTISEQESLDRTPKVRTPVVPIEEEYRGEKVIFSLYFQRDDHDEGGVTAWVADYPLPDYNRSRNLFHHESMNLKTAKQLDETARTDWTELDELERSVELYLATVRSLSPEQLKALELPDIDVQLAIFE